jgi:hypothetical protein
MFHHVPFFSSMASKEMIYRNHVQRSLRAALFSYHVWHIRTVTVPHPEKASLDAAQFNK